MIKTLLFDLDGTLLNMDEEKFLPLYLKSITRFMAGRGIDPHQLARTIMEGSQAMFANSGPVTNKELFWSLMDRDFGPDSRKWNDDLLEYYQTAFDEASTVCSPVSQANEILDLAEDLGFSLVCASNPVFPREAMEARLKWGEIDPVRFDAFSCYDTSTCSKLNPHFYTELCDNLNLKPEECLMIGNSPVEDGNAEKAGLSFFLIENQNYDELADYLRSIASSNQN